MAKPTYLSGNNIQCFCLQSRADKAHYSILTPAIVACRTHIGGSIPLSPLLYNQRVKDITIYHSQLRHLSMHCIQAPPPNHGEAIARQTEPWSNFDCAGVDYARPMIIKSGSIRKPTITKSYFAVFVCFSIKTVHLEVVTSFNNCGIYCNPMPFYRLARQAIRDLEPSQN